MLGIGLAIGLTRRAAAGVETMLARSLATSPATIIALYPFDDTSGSTARDASPNARDAGYVGTYTLGQPGVVSPDVAVQFAGAGSGYVQLPASVRSAFDGTEGTMSAWVRVTDAAVWSNSANNYVGIMRAALTDQVRIFKPTTPGRLTFMYTAGGVSDSVNVDSLAVTDWFHVAMTWSAAADELRAYIDGEQVGSTQTVLGAWSGAISATYSQFAAGSASTALAWAGRMALARLDTAALTPAQIAVLATI